MKKKGIKLDRRGNKYINVEDVYYGNLYNLSMDEAMDKYKDILENFDRKSGKLSFYPKEDFSLSSQSSIIAFYDIIDNSLMSIVERIDVSTLTIQEICNIVLVARDCEGDWVVSVNPSENNAYLDFSVTKENLYNNINKMMSECSNNENS